MCDEVLILWSRETVFLVLIIPDLLHLDWKFWREIKADSQPGYHKFSNWFLARSCNKVNIQARFLLSKMGEFLLFGKRRRS